jgi:hypothetical protein
MAANLIVKVFFVRRTEHLSVSPQGRAEGMHASMYAHRLRGGKYAQCIGALASESFCVSFNAHKHIRTNIAIESVRTPTLVRWKSIATHVWPSIWTALQPPAACLTR